MIDAETMKVIMPGLTIMMGGIFPALSIGWMGSRAMDAIGRKRWGSPKDTFRPEVP